VCIPLRQALSSHGRLVVLRWVWRIQMSERIRKWRLPRARARAERPADPDPAEKFANQAHDLDAVRKTVEDAASVSTGIWLSYIFVLFYIGIAAPLPTNSARKPSQTSVSE
jgi:hypothetical protein